MLDLSNMCLVIEKWRYSHPLKLVCLALAARMALGPNLAPGR